MRVLLVLALVVLPLEAVADDAVIATSLALVYGGPPEPWPDGRGPTSWSVEQYTVQPLRWSPSGGVDRGEPIEVVAEGNYSVQHRIQRMARVVGEDLYLLLPDPDRPGSWRLERRGARAASGPVPAPSGSKEEVVLRRHGVDQPQAFSVEEGLVFLSFGDSVVVFREPDAIAAPGAPRPEPLLRVALPGYKPVDFFLRAGDRVHGVDDIVVPQYLVSFALGGEAGVEPAPIRVLPSLINGRYQQGTVVGDRLYLSWRYSHRGGVGQGLGLFDPGQLPEPSEHSSPFDLLGEGIDPLVGVTEHDPRYTDGAPTLLAGTQFSEWRGLGLLGGELLLGAGARGVLRLAVPLTDPPAAKLLEVDGEVLDLQVADGRAFLLVRREDRQVELVVLERVGDRLEERARERVGRKPERFVERGTP